MKLETLSLFDGVTEGYAIRINGKIAFSYLNNSVERDLENQLTNFKNIVNIGALINEAYVDGATNPDADLDRTCATTHDLDEYMAWVKGTA